MRPLIRSLSRRTTVLVPYENNKPPRRTILAKLDLQPAHTWCYGTVSGLWAAEKLRMKRLLAGLAVFLGTRSAIAEELLLPTPTAPEPRIIAEQGPSPLHYRKSPRVVLPTFRTGFGVQLRLPTDGITGKAAFTADAYFGSTFRFGRDAPTGIITEIGYSYVGFSEHLISVGLGILHGLGLPPKPPGESQPLGRMRIGIIPHGFIGYAYGGFAYGARTSLVLGYWIYGIELAHQLVFAGPRQIHEIHLVFGGVMPMGEDE